MQSAATTLQQQLLIQFRLTRASPRQVSLLVRQQHLQALPQQLVGHVLAARQVTQVSSVATVASLSPLPQQLVGHALAARQAILVSSAATVVSLSLQQLLQLALSAATSPLTAICLSSALSAAQRSNKILSFRTETLMEAVSSETASFVFVFLSSVVKTLGLLLYNIRGDRFYELWSV